MLHDPGKLHPSAADHGDHPLAGRTDTLQGAGTGAGAVAALPVHREKAGLWRKLNDLQSARPMVWINEIPWHEMNVDDELTLPHRPPLGQGAGDAAAPDAVPVAAHARRTWW